MPDFDQKKNRNTKADHEFYQNSHDFWDVR